MLSQWDWTCSTWNWSLLYNVFWVREMQGLRHVFCPCFDPRHHMWYEVWYVWAYWGYDVHCVYMFCVYVELYVSLCRSTYAILAECGELCMWCAWVVEYICEAGQGKEEWGGHWTPVSHVVWEDMCPALCNTNRPGDLSLSVLSMYDLFVERNNICWKNK